jgi:mannosyl-3-phosphoglycerate phosphatase
MKPPAAIIFSDLDGTLLDHEDYRFDAAAPALAAVRAADIPLILTTSKTLAEIAEINQALENPRPAIVENGGALCFPLAHASPFLPPDHEVIDGYAVVRLAAPYGVVRDFIQRQRSAHRWQLRGFGDMTASEVAELTGLDLAAAARARQRLCAEPFLWLDDRARYERLRDEASAARLRITRGGRFHHLMGQTSKAEGMRRMRALLAADTAQAPLVIALGDSENDTEMLQNADIAVVIRRPDGTHLAVQGIRQTLFTEQPGPAGWNAAVLQILHETGIGPAET